MTDDELREMGRNQGWPVTQETKLHSFPPGAKSVRIPEENTKVEWVKAKTKEPLPKPEFTYTTLPLIPLGGVAMGYYEPADILFYSPVLDTA